MAYLCDNIKYQYSPLLFKIEKLEQNTRRQLHNISVRNSLSNKEQVSSILKSSEAELKNLEQQVKGINWTAFLFGFAAFHTFQIFRTKVLLNEMGAKVVPHLAICSVVGLTFGALVGNTFGSNYKVYRKFNCVRKQISNALEQTK